MREEVVSRLPRIAELPFDSRHKYMATFHCDGEWVQPFVKGAPDALLARCSAWRVSQSEQPIDGPRRQQIDAQTSSMTQLFLLGYHRATRSRLSEHCRLTAISWR